MGAYATSLVGVISGLITNLWLLREITRHVSVTDFGIYAFVLQISAYLNILQLGLDFAASREIAEAVGKNRPEVANRAFWELKRINRLSVWAVLAGVLTIASAFWAGLGAPAGGPRNLAATIALLAGTAQIIGFVSRPYSAALIGSQNLPTVNLLTAGRTILTSLIAYVFLVRNTGILAVPMAEILTQTAAWVILHRLIRVRCQWRSNGAPVRDPSLMRSIFKFGSLSTLGGVAWTIEGTSDVIILGWFLGPGAVAVYVLWWRFPQMLFDLCTRLAFSAFPGFAERHGRSAAASRMLFGKVTALSLGLGTLSMVGVSLWLPSFIQLWVGDKFLLSNPRLIASEIGLLICLRTYGNLLAMFWMATGRPTLTTISNWIQAGIKVVFALLLVRSYGLAGLLAASCMAAAVQIVIVGTFLYKEKFLGLSQIVKSASLFALAVMIVLACWTFSLGVNLPRFVFGVFVTGVLWAIIWSLFARTTELKSTLDAIFVEAVNRIHFHGFVRAK